MKAHREQRQLCAPQYLGNTMIGEQTEPKHAHIPQYLNRTAKEFHKEKVRVHREYIKRRENETGEQERTILAQGRISEMDKGEQKRRRKTCRANSWQYRLGAKHESVYSYSLFEDIFPVLKLVLG